MRGSETFNGPVVYDVWRVRRDLLMAIWLLHKAGGHGSNKNRLWRSQRPFGWLTMSKKSHVGTVFAVGSEHCLSRHGFLFLSDGRPHATQL